MKREHDFSKGRRGAVIPALLGKTRITIRIDNSLLRWFRDQVHAASGGSYQTLINSALRDYVKARVEPLEDVLRRVLREERARYMTVQEFEPIRAGATSLKIAEGGRRFPLFSGGGIKVRDFLKILDEDGWFLVRQRGSHRQYKHPSKPGLVTVAGKVSGDLAPGTLNSILKQARLKR